MEDYHSIKNESVYQLLTFLIQSLPQGIHLFISTRVDPPIYLDKLRIQNQLKEIRQTRIYSFCLFMYTLGHSIPKGLRTISAFLTMLLGDTDRSKN